MSEITEPIASAVIIPEPEVPASPPAKRRQSSSPDTASKRTKISQDESAHSPTTRTSPQAPDPQRRNSKEETEDKDRNSGVRDRRRNNIQEERKRGQRLFGGLLNTLSQSTSNGQQKRRQEIEKRQAEKAQQQKIEDEARKAEKLANLRAIRKVEQIKYDEESMRTQHSNILAIANFLATKSEPKLYYKPWKLMPAQEDRIKLQITQAETLIEKEQEAFYRQHPTLWPESIAAERTRKKDDESKETVGEPHIESPSASKFDPDTTNNTISPQPEEPKPTKEGHEEHNGEVVVEAEEDTVIY